MKAGQEKYHARFTDGAEVIEAVLTTQVGKRVAAGEIGELDILTLTGYQCNIVSGVARLITTGVDVVARNQAPLHQEVGSAERPVLP